MAAWYRWPLHKGSTVLPNVYEGIIFLNFSLIIKYILNFNVDRGHFIFIITLAVCDIIKSNWNLSACNNKKMDNGFTGNWLDVMPCSKLWGKGINLDMRDASSYTRIHRLTQFPCLYIYIYIYIYISSETECVLFFQCACMRYVSHRLSQ